MARFLFMSMGYVRKDSRLGVQFARPRVRFFCSYISVFVLC